MRGLLITKTPRTEEALKVMRHQEMRASIWFSDQEMSEDLSCSEFSQVLGDQEVRVHVGTADLEVIA